MTALRSNPTLTDEQIEGIVSDISEARKKGYLNGCLKIAEPILNEYGIELEFTESGVNWKRKDSGS